MKLAAVNRHLAAILGEGALVLTAEFNNDDLHPEVATIAYSGTAMDDARGLSRGLGCLVSEVDKFTLSWWLGLLSASASIKVEAADRLRAARR